MPVSGAAADGTRGVAARHALAARIGWAMLVLVSVAGLAVFVAYHALGPAIAVALLALPATVITVGLSVGLPMWLPCVLTLLPVADLAMWTGQIYFTESDALVLLTVALVGTSMAARRCVPRALDSTMTFGSLQWLLVLLLLASYLFSTDWTPLARLGSDPALLVGYVSPLNGVRLAKGMLLALMLLPAAFSTMRAYPQLGPVSLGYGILASLAAVSLAALWERMAFPGLTDFAADYRTVALFWEMNVGGAQLDGWLALCLPFLLWALVRERSSLRLASIAMLSLLAGYVTFTTFSRGLYLGAALGLATTGLLLARESLARLSMRRAMVSGLFLALALTALGVLLSGVFQVGGYRGMFATLGLCALALLGLRHAAAASWLVGLGGCLLAGLLGLGGALVALAVPKGVYVLYAAVAAVAAAVLFWLRAAPLTRANSLTVISLIGWMAVNAALVSIYWAKPETSPEAAVAASIIVMALLFVARGRDDVIPVPTFKGIVAAAATFALLSVAVVGSNTYYASTRMSAVAADLEARKQHWHSAAALPNPYERWLGIGTGQFPQRFLLVAPPEQTPGDHTLIKVDGQNALQLLAPTHVLGLGELYRVTQRISATAKLPLRLEFVARSPRGPSMLYVEACRRHVLYAEGCRQGSYRIASDASWQRGTIFLPGDGAIGGTSPLGPPASFSIANQYGGSLVEIAQLSLTDSAGRELLSNGAFMDGASYWFFSSDRYHLPWHAKNLPLHYWVEQGWLGLFAFASLVGVALYRITLGGGAGHPLAPPLAGALVAMLTVGVFDSLVDAPRMALLIFTLLFLALGLRHPSKAALSDPRSIFGRSARSESAGYPSSQSEMAESGAAPGSPATKGASISLPGGAHQRSRRAMSVTSLCVIRNFRRYLAVAGLVMGVTLLVLFIAGRIFLADYSVGDLVHKLEILLRQNHPTVSAMVRGVIEATGAKTSSEAAVGKVLPPFPGPEAWPRHGPVGAGFQQQRFDSAGVPLQSSFGPFVVGAGADIVRVSDVAGFVVALRAAKAGQVITLAPGDYSIKQSRIVLGGSGSPTSPIIVRAERFGDVRIRLDGLEGFYVDKPYWVFENLSIHGACRDDSQCEHAFHVVGDAVGTVLRNNELIDFNAALKVNGLFGPPRARFPDHGLVQNNSVFNTRIRDTGNPVTLLNIDAADGWVVAGNFIADSAKGKGDRVSYAGYMKSNSRSGVFERNLVVCHWRIPPSGGARVGLSFGGGGTAGEFSRNGDSTVEHTDGVMRNNLIVRCPTDVGIYLNKAANTLVLNNAILSSRGIDVRFPPTHATIRNNVLDGRIADRDGGHHDAENNLDASVCGLWSRLTGHCDSTTWYKNPTAGDFRGVKIDEILGRVEAGKSPEFDFCGYPRKLIADIGPIEYGAGPPCFPVH